MYRCFGCNAMLSAICHTTTLFLLKWDILICMRILELIVVISLAIQCKSNSQNDPTPVDPVDIDVSYDVGEGLGDGICEQGYIADGISIFDAYPGSNTDYPMMDVIDYPTAFVGEDFESYSNNSLIASSSSSHQYIDVTSGSLYAKHFQGSQVWKRGYTTTHNFRMLAVGTYDGMPIRYRDGKATLKVYFDNIQSNPAHYAGAHIFMRYQTEYDLYVASLRHDGQVMIKKKHCGNYTTLAVAYYSGGDVQTDTWYDIAFETRGTDLYFYVNGNLELTAVDGDLSWGSTGVRIDDSDTYIDDWYLEE
jgi:hypothetical protein